MDNFVSSTCHCGAVEIRLSLPNGIEHVKRCSCSMCSRKYSVFTCVDLKNLDVIKGKNNLQEYTFHTHNFKYWFCSICTLTHHQARDTPTQYVVKLACLEGIKVENYEYFDWLNGRESPKDNIFGKSKKIEL